MIHYIRVIDSLNIQRGKIFLWWCHWVVIIILAAVWKLHSGSLSTWFIGKGISNLSVKVRHGNFLRYLGEIFGQGIRIGYIYHCIDIICGHLRTSLPKLANIAVMLLLRSIFSVWLQKLKQNFNQALTAKNP